MGEAEHLVEVGGSHEDRRPLPEQLLDDAVDLFTRSDIDAASGLVDEEELGPLLEPFAEGDLLLIAARERGNRSTRTGADVHLADAALGEHVRGRFVVEPEPGRRAHDLRTRQEREG